MKDVYKFDVKKMWKPVKESIWFYLLLLVSIISNYFMTGMIGVIIVFSIFGVFILFHFILHIQYCLHDRDTTVIIDHESRVITFQNKDCRREFQFDNILLIKYCKGSRDQKTLSQYVMPSNFYNWIKIDMKNGESASFSDFIKPDLNIYGLPKQVKVIPFLNIMN